MDEKKLRRALLTLRQAGEIELRHVYGEINSLWEARETVRKFLRETAAPEPVESPCRHCSGTGIIEHGYMRGFQCACGLADTAREPVACGVAADGAETKENNHDT
jgi:hypothetical protein